MRICELARELGITSKALLADLRDRGMPATNHQANLSEEAEKLIRAARGAAAKPIPAPAVPAPATPSAPAPSAEFRPEAGPKPKAEAGPKAEPARAVKVEDPSAPKPEAKPKPEIRVEVTPRAEAKPEAKPQPTPPAPTPPPAAPPAPARILELRGPIVVKDLAQKLGMRPNQLIAELMGMNILANLNEALDIRVVRAVAEKHGFNVQHEKRIEEHKQAQRQRLAEAETEEQDRPGDLAPRGPVVTFMGHVDHGKTSLLDKIRNTRVAAGESGGITQHIGAYTVDMKKAKITFLDTPGHAAFTAMRARGAKLTDIAVIVVAADDGVMPQTKEAISHAQAAEVAMVAAINKVDLPAANVDKVKGQLRALGLTPEDWGGDLICCPVSAVTGAGIDQLLDMILLQAEMLELKANPRRGAQGYAIEAQLEAGMGPTATLLVTNGTLSVGDALLCGAQFGKVKALINDRGVRMASAPPATAVKCLGLAGVPEAGDAFKVCSSEKTARALAEETLQGQKGEQVGPQRKASIESLMEQIKQSEKKELKVVLKADTQGSLEAISQALLEIKSDKISLAVILKGAGNITANDVMLAAASGAVVLGFYVSKEPGVDTVAKQKGVEIRMHRIIYELLDEVRGAMTGLLAPKFEERIRGRAVIKQVFLIGKRGKVAGCQVYEGYAGIKLRVRLKRKTEVLHDGALASLKRFQEDVSQVKDPQECGLRLENYTDFTEGDTLEFYELEEVKQSL
ncbi:MAG: translation initiation factor IF-2 [Verrucomicrobiota bacterium]|nr:translation initiation factor IF-2 [Verrucomicrobiota bacterium]